MERGAGIFGRMVPHPAADQGADAPEPSRRSARRLRGVARSEAALSEAERLGGTRLLGPAKKPGNELVVGHFRDPQGNAIGVAGGP